MTEVTLPKKKRVKKDKEALNTHIAKISKKDPTKKVSKLKPTSVRSIFGDSAENILQLLQSPEQDNAQALIMTKLMQMLVDVIPYTEHQVRKTKGAKGTYQMKSLVSEIRELMIDIQAVKDRGRVGEIMIEQVIRPFLLDLGTTIIQRFDFVLRDAQHRMDKKEFKAFKKETDTHMYAIADNIQSSALRLQDELKEYLQR